MNASFLRLPLASLLLVLASAWPTSSFGATQSANEIHPHVRVVGGKYQTEPGYIWTNPGLQDNYDVIWTAGASYPGAAHVISGEKEGDWLPEHGYHFANQMPGDFTVVRTISETSVSAPVTTAVAQSLPPHVEEVNGKYRAEAGYAWAQPNVEGNFEVVWVPGVVHPQRAHVVSGNKQDVWFPARGYRFANEVPGDFTVVAAGPTDEQLSQAAQKIVLALVTNYIAQQESSGLLEAFVVEAARQARNELVRQALDDLFTGVPRSELRAAASLITLAADGRLTGENWLSQQKQAELRERLAASSADTAETYQVAQFVGSVLQTYSQSR